MDLYNAGHFKNRRLELELRNIRKPWEQQLDYDSKTNDRIFEPLPAGGTANV